MFLMRNIVLFALFVILSVTTVGAFGGNVIRDTGPKPTVGLPTSVGAGYSVNGTVTLDQTPTSNVTVSLSTAANGVTVPATVTVLANTNSVGFQLSVSGSSTANSASVTAMTATGFHSKSILISHGD